VQPAFLLTKFVGHRKSVQTMATTSDHRLVWSGDSLGIVRIHSVENRMFLKEINSGGTIYTLQCVNANMWLCTSDSLQIRNATVRRESSPLTPPKAPSSRGLRTTVDADLLLLLLAL
jgi:WD40 repeat protein